MKNDNKSRLEKLKSFKKELDENPRRKALFKLSGYLIFFIILFVLAAIASRVNVEDSDKQEEVTTNESFVSSDNYVSKQKKLQNETHNINFVINKGGVTYIINGSLKDMIINGYLEENSVIKKIIIKDGLLYEIINNEETQIDLGIDTNMLSIEYLLRTIKQNKAYIEDKEDTKVYKYSISINDILNNIVVYSDKEKIYKIEINNEFVNYILNFDN